MTSATARPTTEQRLGILVLFDHLKQSQPTKYDKLRGKHIQLTQSRAFGIMRGERYKTMYVVSGPDFRMCGHSRLEPHELEWELRRDVEQLAKDGIYLWYRNEDERRHSMR